jgi:hypothetical protein
MYNSIQREVIMRKSYSFGSSLNAYEFPAIVIAS